MATATLEAVSHTIVQATADNIIEKIKLVVSCTPSVELRSFDFRLPLARPLKAAKKNSGLSDIAALRRRLEEIKTSAIQHVSVSQNSDPSDDNPCLYVHVRMADEA
jgi:hypothetical protein